ncbi:hypothetical protein NECID01_0230 [Nematocida sp. AWRm77]|nr:hypothetical protein NECID01_0230 [Nematocida sp. AWRm77]
MRIEGRVSPSTEVSPDIGLGSVPTQILKKAVQRGLVFNLLVVAEKGTGARTLVSSVYNLDKFPPVTTKHSENLTEHACTLRSESVSLHLNVYLYRGRSPEEVSAFIVSRNFLYNKHNIGIKRERMEDPRVHASLFLVSPLSFRSEDVLLLKALSEVSNTIPVIPKRDIFTASELSKYKELICAQIKQHSVSLCHPSSFSAAYPLSTVASCSFITEEGKSVRGRVYKWGSISAEDPEVSDLPVLVSLLLTQSFVWLKKSTAQYYSKWKDEISSEPSRLPLSSQEEELLKEIEYTITQRLDARLKTLEKDEKLLDQAVQSLTPPSIQG